jgi:hypothetical protein
MTTGITVARFVRVRCIPRSHTALTFEHDGPTISEERFFNWTLRFDDQKTFYQMSATRISNNVFDEKTAK